MSLWADLPVEVLDMISKCLDSRLDFLCFRAVCTSWRYSASLPSFDQEVPRLILKLPPPFHADAILMQTAVCRMEPISEGMHNQVQQCWVLKNTNYTPGEGMHNQVQQCWVLKNTNYTPGSQIFEMQSKLRMSQCNLSNLVSISVAREGGIIHLTDTS